MSAESSARARAARREAAAALGLLCLVLAAACWDVLLLGRSLVGLPAEDPFGVADPAPLGFPGFRDPLTARWYPPRLDAVRHLGFTGLKLIDLTAMPRRCVPSGPTPASCCVRSRGSRRVTVVVPSSPMALRGSSI